MNSPLRFSLELFASSYWYSHKIESHIPDSVLVWFLELSGNHENVEKSFHKELNMISKDNFEKKYRLHELRESIEKRKSVLISSFKELKPSDEYLVYLTDLLFKKYGRLYENYIYQNNHVREREIIVYQFNENELSDIYSKIQLVANDIIKLKMLKRVESELLFSDMYTIGQATESQQEEIHEKIEVSKPSEACNWELRKKPKMGVDELIKVIKSKYDIKLYDNDHSSKINNRNLIKAIRTNHKRFQERNKSN